MRKQSRRRRILSVLLGGALGLLAAAWLVLPRVVAPVLRGKLEALVKNHLPAELKLADLSYRFPYTVRVTDARLIVRGGPQDGLELLRLGSGTLALEELPLRRGPLRIRSIELDRPTLHVVRETTGEIGAGELLVRADDDARAKRPDQHMKLSDLFRLRRLTLRGGKVIYEDRARPDAPPMVWDNLTTDLNIAPRQASVYDFRYSVNAAPPGAGGLGRGTVANLSARGSIDIDQLIVSVDELLLKARADPGASQTSVPAVIQEFVQQHEIAGAVRVEGSGTVPLREPGSASFKASLELVDARARVRRFDRTLERLDLRLELEKPANVREIALRAPTILARASPADVTIADARGTLDWTSQTWRLTVPQADARFDDAAGSLALALDVTGSLDRGRIHWDRSSGRATLHEVTLRPAGFPHALANVNGTIQLIDGAARAEQLSGRYGADAWSVSSARVVLSNLPDRIDVTDLAASATFAPPSPPYPKGLTGVIAGLRPAGTFNVTGGFARDRAAAAPKARWDLLVTSDGGGALAVTDRRIPITSIRAAAHVTREQIEIARFVAHSCDGALAGTLTIDPRRPVSYRGELSVENVDLRELVERLRDAPETTQPGFAVSGRLGGNVSLESEGGSAEMLGATGELVVHDGVLWEVPVVSHVVGQTRVARDALRAGDAGAVFELRDGVIHVRHAAVSSPTLGLQGWGTIDLRDGRRALDLDVVAAPLGDWEQHLKGTKVPLVSDAAGAVAGAMQKVLNTATSTLLYEFLVTGTPSNPHLSAVPAPVLTEAAARVLQGMLKHEKDVMKHQRQREGRREREPRWE